MAASTIANTILTQLGGRRFIAMTGATQLIFNEHGTLSMRIGKNAKSVNYFSVKLLPSDTYQLTFGRFRKLKLTVLSEFHNVYADQLRSIFEQETQLYTSL